MGPQYCEYKACVDSMHQLIHISCMFQDSQDRRHTNSQQVHEKMFNITNHQESKSQNKEILPHTG